MARSPFETMPVDGPRDARSTSRIVNQAMAGKLNSVVDFTIPVNGLPFVLNDVRLSSQSYVDLMPLNAAAALSEVFWAPGNGILTIDEPELADRNAICQVSAIDDVGPDLLGGAKIPFETIDLDVNWTIDEANDRITAIVEDATIKATFTYSGTYASGTDFDFGIAKFSSGGTLLGSFTVGTSTSNQNDVISVSGSTLFDITAGEYVEPYGVSETSATFSPYDMTLILERLAGVPGSVNSVEELQYRAVIIG